MELKNVNSNGENTMANNLNNTDIFLKIEFKKQGSYVTFLQDVAITSKKNLHIV
jgi:hypothetical protein